MIEQLKNNSKNHKAGGRASGSGLDVCFGVNREPLGGLGLVSFPVGVFLTLSVNRIRGSATTLSVNRTRAPRIFFYPPSARIKPEHGPNQTRIRPERP